MDAVIEGTRTRLAVGALNLEKARKRWEKARALLPEIDTDQQRRQYELKMILDEGRAASSWIGWQSDDAGNAFQRALEFVDRGTGSEAAD